MRLPKLIAVKVVLIDIKSIVIMSILQISSFNNNMF